MNPARTGLKRSRRLLAACVLIGAGVLLVIWIARDSAEERAESLIQQARSELASGDYAEAESSALLAFEWNPLRYDAALMAAECARAQRQYEQAVEHASLVANADSKQQLRAELLIANLEHQRLYRLSRAEAAYRRALAIDEDSIEANTELAILLGTCARRSEAVPSVIRLIRAGEVTDLLILLSRDSGMINDTDLLEKGRQADPSDPAPLVGLAWHAAENDQPTEARRLLEEAIRLDPQFAPAQIALLQLLLDQGDTPALTAVLADLPTTASDSAIAWEVRGKLWQDVDAAAATRCLLEAIAREPESNGITAQLSRLLNQLGEDGAAARFSNRQDVLQSLRRAQDEVIFSGRVDGPSALLRLADSYDMAGRVWEALGWCRMALTMEGEQSQTRLRLRELEVRAADLSLQLTAQAASPVHDFDMARFTLPAGLPDPLSGAASNAAASDHSLPQSLLSVSFDRTAEGFNFQYVNGTVGEPSRRMFEFTGGGIGVIDFDGDTWPDAYCSQGGVWDSRDSDDAHHDQLLRNMRGVLFEAVADAAGIREIDFGQGVAVGDLDADGFPDLFVANIGANRVWWNNGDGTFRDGTSESGIRGDEWTTSCTLADLNGDTLPDCYAVNYVRGSDVFDRLCPDENGIPRMCTPLHFEAETDRIWINNGDYTFRDGTAELLSFTPAGKGLGVAVWKPNEQSGLSVFVANDTTPNFFFTLPAGPDQTQPAADDAVAFGLAVNNDGKSEGCMGIAVGDFSGDDTNDLYVTNFLRESNTAYVSSESGLFQDRTLEMKGEPFSLNMLGFGTQTIDADLDGTLEIFVANGHIDDLQDVGKPFRMRPQLLSTGGGVFQEIPPAGLGVYFNEEWRGRAVATLDWNHDLRPDLIVGHLQDPTALLSNRSADTGHAVTMRLISNQTARDAIGASITATIGDRTVHRQLTAGDGYQASNERRLVIGAGAATEIDLLSIRWPSGETQEFENVAAPGALIAVEGRPLLSEPY